MATFVLVHGSNDGGWIWKKPSPLLRSAGHEVYAPTLSRLADRSHLLGCGVNLTTHITDIVNLLFYEDPSEVILVGNGSLWRLTLSRRQLGTPGAPPYCVFSSTARKNRLRPRISLGLSRPKREPKVGRSMSSRQAILLCLPPHLSWHRSCWKSVPADIHRLRFISM